jgi:hypothetical protein
MRRIAIIVLAMVVGVPAVMPAVQEQPAPDERAAVLREFQHRVDAYVEFHRRFEDPLPFKSGEAGSWSMLLAQQYLATAIREARSKARQGDIFSPAAAAIFREVIAQALEGRDTDAFLREFYLPHPVTHAVHPIVNEPYPKSITHEVPPVVLRRLPLPGEHLEYRIAGHDLLLWDVHADILVDLVQDAFPSAGSISETPRGPGS